MLNFDLLAATRTTEQSMPFVVYRMLVYIGAGFGYLIATLAGAGTFIGLGALSKNANAFGLLGAAVGFFAFAFLMIKLQRWTLMSVRIPQMALLADLASSRVLPAGKAQVDYARQKVAGIAPSSAAVVELDQQIRRGLGEICTLHPGQGALAANPLAKRAGEWLMGNLVARNHLTLWGWHFLSGAGEPRDSMATGLAVHYKYFRRLTMDRGIATTFEWLGFAAAYPLFLIAAQKIVADLPVTLGVWPHIFAGVFAWSLKATFLEPIAEAAMLQSFSPLARDHVDGEETSLLQENSAAFRELREA
jgi:hypothetical protein